MNKYVPLTIIRLQSHFIFHYTLIIFYSLMSGQVKKSPTLVNHQQKTDKDQKPKHKRSVDLSQQKEQKNVTQIGHIDHQQSSMAKLRKGFSQIYNKINFRNSFDNFSQAFDQYQIPAQEQTINNIRPQLQSKGQEIDYNDNQIQHLNQTPFFSIDQEITKKKTQQSLLDNVLKKVAGKNKEALQQIQTNFIEKQKPEQLIQKIFNKIFNKNSEALDQLRKKINENLLKNQKPLTQKKSIYIEEDNEFISEQFGSQQKLEEVRKYVKELKSNQIDEYIQENQRRVHNMVNFVSLIQNIVDRGLKQMSLQIIKRWKIKTPLSSSPENRAISQRISSAQSQRIKSGVSKNSEIDDSFNLDLTVKTKNSKNPYQLGKMDSLMYSADSGFGLMSESPNKDHKVDEHSNSSKSVKHKLDDMIEERNQTPEDRKGSVLKKNHSQKIYNQKHENLKRQMTSKQKIDEDDNDNDHEQHQSPRNGNQIQNISLHEINSSQNLQKSNMTAQFAFEGQEANYQNEKTKKNQQQILKNKVNIKKKVQVRERNSKSIRSKNKNRQTQEMYGQNTSIKQDTIVNKLQNFDADDQDQNYQEKELHESVNLNKNNSTEQLVRKRVETQAGKNKKELKKQQSNYSIKNIKRFNKIDLSKYQQGHSHQNSRATPTQVSENNIFATQINSYHNKISRLKEQKQMKKRILEKELARINYQIKVINQKQEEMSPQSNNNYASRLKISDNTDAQRKAQSLVKNLRSQKKNRNMAKIGQFNSLDKNINDYMEELTKLRSQNEEKTKQKKKLQILERMKQNEMRKINEKKKITQNQQFVLHLKGSNSNYKVEPIAADLPSKRTTTKNQQEVVSSKIEVITPQLSQKKAYLNKIRSFSMKKRQQKDVYEQALN